MKGRKEKNIKVKVRNLTHNPLIPDIDRYPIDRNKVEHFIDLFNNNRFLEIRGRKNGDLYEIAYGHHRLNALQDERSGYGMDAEVTIIVGVPDYTDDEMFWFFKNENDEIYAPTPQWYNVMVEMARDRLRGNWDLVRTIIDNDAKPSDIERIRNRWEKGIVGETTIAKHLKYPASRVQICLRQIELMEKVDKNTGKPVLDRDAVNRFKDQKSADAFAKKVKQAHEKGATIPKEEQRATADDHVENDKKADDMEDSFKKKSPAYRNHTRPKKPSKRERLEGEVLRKKLMEDLDIVLFSTGKERLTDTKWVTVHEGYLITEDDNIATIAPTDLKLSCAFRPALQDTLNSCRDEWVRMLFKGGHIDVVMDSGSSTVPAKPIEDVKYLTDIEGLPWKDLPHDFFRAVAECFSFRGESQLVSCYEEELLTLVTGNRVYTTDMHRAGMYTMKDPVEEMYLPYWLASTIKDMYKINQVPQGYAIKDGRIYFRLSNKGVIVTEIPEVDDSRFPKEQIIQVFKEFKQKEAINLSPLNGTLKDCESKYKAIKVLTDRMIQLNFDGENLTINTLDLSKAEGEVNRKVACSTEEKYQFKIPISHLEQDTMYVGEDRILFERGNYQQIVKTGGGYLIKHNP